MTPDWGNLVGDVVDGWLFPEPERLPPVLLVPLENPHLHDSQAWQEVVGPPASINGVVACHRIGGHEIGVAKAVLGAASTAMLADAVARRGVRAVIGIGFCGGTDPVLQSGDVMAATCAHAMDGVSLAYDPGRTIAEAECGLLALVGDRALAGPVLSVAAVHLEDQELVERCAGMGVRALDMETAALYTVAGLRGMAALSVLTVSDVPARGALADSSLLAKGFSRALELGASIALEADRGIKR